MTGPTSVILADLGGVRPAVVGARGRVEPLARLGDARARRPVPRREQRGGGEVADGQIELLRGVSPGCHALAIERATRSR